MDRERVIDDFSPADYAEPGYYDECTGEFYPAHRAGDRNTGPKPLVYSFLGLHEVGDILVLLERARKRLAKVPAADAWDMPTLRAKYDYFRLIAMRPSTRSRLLQAEMLALASRCVNRGDELRAAA